MAKDITKLKEEMKVELAKLKDEMRQEMKAFRENLERDLRNEIRELKNEQKSMCQSLEFAHGTIADVKKKLDNEVSKNALLVSENEALRVKCASLEGNLQEVESRLVLSEQYSRRNNLEIQGVAKTEEESLTEVLGKIGTAINEPIGEADIEVCHRVPTRSPEKTNIIVQFKSRAKRDTVLKKAKKTRLTSEDMGQSDKRPIYVNEHLCPALKKLLALTVKKKHENKWKSVWSSNGKIFAKQTDDAPTLQVKSERDIDRIFSKQWAATVTAAAATAAEADVV